MSINQTNLNSPTSFYGFRTTRTDNNDAIERLIKNDKLRNTMLTHGKTTTYSAREVLYREGDHSDTLFFVERGMIKLLSYLPNGRVRIVRLHAKGSWIGMAGLIKQPNEHTAIAVSDVEVKKIPVQELRRFKTDDPTLYCEMLEKWFDHLKEADVWISQFSTGSIRSRVARLINFLSEIDIDSPNDEVKLLTCEEMAAILGVTPESVSRTVAEFKRERLLYAPRRGAYNCFTRDAQALRLAAMET